MNQLTADSSDHNLVDPLEKLLHDFPPQAGKIKKSVPGAMYHATLLHNGQLGVCATLGFPVSAPPLSSEPDLSDPSQRIPLISYYNALFNPEAKEHDQLDIFSHLDFSHAGSIVMIGFFRPLVKKFDATGIPVKVYDINQEDPRLTDYETLSLYLKKADSVIITSTTLVNNTFPGIIRQLKRDACAYLLGPSTLLHPVMFGYPNIKALYGMKFQADDERVIQVISANGGTPEFSGFATKVCMKS